MGCKGLLNFFTETTIAVRGSIEYNGCSIAMISFIGTGYFFFIASKHRNENLCFLALKMRGPRRVPELIAEALARYENIREQVYKELEIKYVQQTVKNRILKRENSGVELLFFREVDEVDSDALISDDATVEFDSTSSRVPIHEGHDELEDDSEGETKSIQNVTLGNYLDIEAEHSGEEEEEELKDEDLDSLIDDSCDGNIELDEFVNEKLERDNKILENLRKRFVKPGRQSLRNSTEGTSIDNILPDAPEDFPEIREIELDFEETHLRNDQMRLNLDLVTERSKFSRDEVLFNDESFALEKLSKKEEKRNTGFFEKKDT